MALRPKRLFKFGIRFDRNQPRNLFEIDNRFHNTRKNQPIVSQYFVIGRYRCDDFAAAVYLDQKQAG